MTIFSLTVVRNEADRYLDQVLGQLVEVVDQSFVFDDCSTDDSTAIATAAGCMVIGRAERGTTPSFLEHEGRFRQGAWESFEFWMMPEVGDWVLSVDADEFLATYADPRQTVLAVTAGAEARGYGAISIRVPEVFGQDVDGCPLIRRDGAWDTITGVRLFRYQPGGRFPDRAMASGSTPTYVGRGHVAAEPSDLFLLHYGYAVAADRSAKHERYSTLSGHSSAHVQSIVGPRTLERWDGPWAPVRVPA